VYNDYHIRLNGGPVTSAMLDRKQAEDNLAFGENLLADLLEQRSQLGN